MAEGSSLAFSDTIVIAAFSVIALIVAVAVWKFSSFFYKRLSNRRTRLDRARSTDFLRAESNLVKERLRFLAKEFVSPTEKCVQYLQSEELTKDLSSESINTPYIPSEEQRNRRFKLSNLLMPVVSQSLSFPMGNQMMNYRTSRQDSWARSNLMRNQSREAVTPRSPLLDGRSTSLYKQ